MKKLTSFLVGMITLSAVPAACFGQDGSDINQAIPVYFGQTINDTIDGNTRPYQVYSITLARGQQFSLLAKTNSFKKWNLCLIAPGVKSILANNCLLSNGPNQFGNGVMSLSLDYQAAAAGTYYFDVFSYDPGVTYQLQITATGTPIATPNPLQAGCLSGQVDYITYSLQLIAANLPDEASIGGTKLCTTCTVKPPAYPQLISKMETAMGLNVGISACYDSAGNVFQIKMTHP